MRNSLIKSFFLVLAILLAAPLSLSAHETKTSGTLEVLLHMEPLDNPAAGEQAQLYFSVADTAEKFKYADCACTVTVKDPDGNQILSHQVTADDDAPDWGVNVIRVPIVFPKIGIYQVAMAGTSAKNTFAAFNLEYDKRIERESASQPLAKSDNAGGNSLLRNYYIIGGIVIVLGIIIYEIISKLRKRKL